MIDNKELIALADEVYGKLNLKTLTRRQRLFVLRFDGRSPKDVAADAGYTNPSAAATRLMTIPAVRECINIVSKALEHSIVASKLDVLQFWTRIMNSETEDTSHRLNAGEKLGRVHELLGPNSVTNVKVNQDNKIVIMVQSHDPVDEAEQIKFDRITKEMQEQTRNELMTMGRATSNIIEAEVIDDSDLMI